MTEEIDENTQMMPFTSYTSV